MELLCLLLRLYIYALFGRIILSWFPISPGSGLASVFSALYTVTEPVLGPVRRLLPPIGMGGMGLDLSPIIVTFAFQFLLAPLLGC
jgi:YggT family protein